MASLYRTGFRGAYNHTYLMALWQPEKDLPRQPFAPNFGCWCLNRQCLNIGMFKHWHLYLYYADVWTCQSSFNFRQPIFKQGLPTNMYNYALLVFKRFGQNGIKGGWLSSELTILKKKNSNSDNYTFLGFCFLRSSLEYFSATIIISDRHWQCLLSLVCLLLSF